MKVLTNLIVVTISQNIYASSHHLHSLNLYVICQCYLNKAKKKKKAVSRFGIGNEQDELGASHHEKKKKKL